MYDTAERVRRVKSQIQEIKCKRKKQMINSLFAFCTFLLFSLVGIIGLMTGRTSGVVQGSYGAMMLFEAAGSYVLVGLISFTLAVIITLICIRYKEKNK